MAEPVEKMIEVKCTPETAFRVFTAGVDSWWPKDRNSLSAMEGKKAQSIRLDPRLGGTMIETAHDGKRHVWGSVTRYEPAQAADDCLACGQRAGQGNDGRCAFQTGGWRHPG